MTSQPLNVTGVAGAAPVPAGAAVAPGVSVMSACEGMDCAVTRVEDDQTKHRYVAYNSAGVEMGWLGYRVEKGVLVIWTTRTEPEFRGHGVADVMTRYAMDAAIAAGTPVQPDCWYASEWIQKHPKYAKHVIDPGF